VGARILVAVDEPFRVVAYVPDLIDRSKVAAAAPGARFVATPEELADAARDADLVVVDLGRPGVLEAVGGLSARTVAFARHTAVELIASARAAGVETVVARSQFFARVGDYVR
jgi:hypothetical protein